MVYNLEIAEKLGPAIQAMTTVVDNYEKGIAGSLEVAQTTGSTKLIKSVEEMQEAFPALKKTFEEAIESVEIVKKNYDNLQEALG